MIFNSFPVLIHLIVVGCLCFASTLQAHRTKFQPRARKAVFLGFENGTKGYFLYDMSSHEMFVSRNVVFYEHVFPFKPVSNPVSANP